MNKSIQQKSLKNKFFSFNILFISFLFTTSSYACTILSGIDCNGQVWNANNEDGPEGIANFINIFPKTNETKYGYYTLSYFSPKNGEGGNIQGGMNEAGLTFDFNAIAYVEDFDVESKRAFPKGDNVILPHILANMSSVQEVIDFFDDYWFQKGFLSAQMHVADRNGRFAIISASGTQLVEKGQSLVSTNFDICGNEDGSSCWRYPIATEKLSKLGASLSTMLSICQETAQNQNGIVTMYSNIQNLTTGDIWFFSVYDPNIIVSTNIKELLSKGRRSYTFNNLKSLKEGNERQQWNEPKLIELKKNILDKYQGTYTNMMVGEITISSHENGYWSFSAWRDDEPGTNQLPNSKSGLKIETTPTRGTGFKDSHGSELFIAHVTNTITNDSTIPIHLQIDLPIEFSYPFSDDTLNFKIVMWPGLTEPPHLYSDSQGQVMENFTGNDLGSSNQFNQLLAPGEEYIVTIGTIFPRLPKICSAVAYSFLEYNNRRNYSDCDWSMNEEHSANPQLALGLHVGFCTSGRHYDSCTIITCGQIAYIED